MPMTSRVVLTRPVSSRPAVNGTKYYNDEFIFIANDEAIERQKSGKIPKHQVGPGDFWVARILEIRASDEHHVYARVFWMYSPDELPAATVSGKKTAAGRQPHHGINELIASNHSMFHPLLPRHALIGTSGYYQCCKRCSARSSQPMDRIQRRGNTRCSVLAASI